MLKLLASNPLVTLVLMSEDYTVTDFSCGFCNLYFYFSMEMKNNTCFRSGGKLIFEQCSHCEKKCMHYYVLSILIT